MLQQECQRRVISTSFSRIDCRQNSGLLESALEKFLRSYTLQILLLFQFLLNVLVSLQQSIMLQHHMCQGWVIALPWNEIYEKHFRLTSMVYTINTPLKIKLPLPFLGLPARCNAFFERPDLLLLFVFEFGLLLKHLLLSLVLLLFQLPSL